MAAKKKPNRVKAKGGKSRPAFAENVSYRKYPDGRTVKRTDKTARDQKGDEVITTTTTTWHTFYGKEKKT